MFLSFLKAAVKATLHSAIDEWMVETGFSEADVAQVQAERALSVKKAALLADARERAALIPDKTIAAAVVVRAAANAGVAPPADVVAVLKKADEEDPLDQQDQLMLWVHERRAAGDSWPKIVEAASSEKGVTGVSASAMRSRFARWEAKQVPVQTVATA